MKDLQKAIGQRMQKKLPVAASLYIFTKGRSADFHRRMKKKIFYKIIIALHCIDLSYDVSIRDNCVLSVFIL